MSEPTVGREMGMVFDMRCAWLRVTSLLCTALLIPGDLSVIVAQQASQSAQAPAMLSPDYLDSLVAPIALYPDPLLAQVLAASTYPLEVIQLEQWLEKHKDLKGKALVDAVAKETWDPSVQGLADLPDVVRQLGDNIKWTTELGNAFLAQQSDVMNAVQRMRAKAQGTGKLKSSDQMKVETTVVDNKSVVVIEQANPQVVYVPSYDPAVVWGAPAYPYPPVYYPPAGYYAAGMAISFGVGVAMGAFWGGGGWGYNCGWGGNNSININNNNNFIRNSNNRISGGNQIRGGNQIGGGNRATQWQHNPQHRGGAPYADRTTANRFGGTTRGDTTARREANARQNLGQRGGTGGNRLGAGGAGGFTGNRPGGGGSGFTGNRPGGGGASGLTGNRGGPGGAGGPGNRGSGNRGGGDRIGNRQIPSGGAGGAFGGARGGGAGARANGSRGASSFGGSRGGSRGGGRRR